MAYDLGTLIPIIAAFALSAVGGLVLWFSRTNTSGALVQSDINYIKRDVSTGFEEVKQLIREKDNEWSKSRDALTQNVTELSKIQELHSYQITEIKQDIDYLKRNRNGGTRSPV